LLFRTYIQVLLFVLQLLLHEHIRHHLIGQGPRFLLVIFPFLPLASLLLFPLLLLSLGFLFLPQQLLLCLLLPFHARHSLLLFRTYIQVLLFVLQLLLHEHIRHHLIGQGPRFLLVIFPFLPLASLLLFPLLLLSPGFLFLPQQLLLCLLLVHHERERALSVFLLRVFHPGRFFLLFHLALAKGPGQHVVRESPRLVGRLFDLLPSLELGELEHLGLLGLLLLRLADLSLDLGDFLPLGF